MDQLHQTLMKNSSWYQQWHQDTRHQKIQWLLFVLVGVLFTALIVGRVQNPESISYGVNILAAENSSDHAQNQYRQAAELTKDLLESLRNYEQSPDQDQALSELLQAAETRQQFLLTASASTPDIALRNAIAPGLLSRFPDSVQSLLEKDVKVAGTLSVTVDENLKQSHEGHFSYDLASTNGKKYQLYFSGERRGLKTGDKVSVTGLQLDTALIVDSSATNNLTVTAPASLPTASTLRKVGVILINFTDNAAQPFTPEQIRAVAFTDSTGMNGYFPEMSFNHLGLTGALRTDGDVFGWYTIPFAAGSGCDKNSWAQAAENAASANGFVRTNYDSVIYEFPAVSSCTFTGSATVGGQPALIWVNEWFELGIVAHELGHNLGLYHANSYTCHQDSPTGPIVSISNYCSSTEYGDPSDMMGGASQSHFGNYQKGRPYGGSWYAAGNTQTLDPVANPSGTYTLAPLETATTGVQVLRIPRGADASGPLFYYLEFRQPLGFDSTLNPAITNGVIIRLAPDYNVGNATKMIDTTATTTPNNFYDGALAPGQTFTDPYFGVTVTTNSVSAAGASVSVSLTPSSCVHANPTISLTPSSQTGVKGQTLTYTMSVTNNDGASCASSTFTVTTTVPAGWFVSTNPFNFNLAPGATFGSPINISSSFTAGPGTYNITQTAKNTGSPSFTASATAAYVVQGDSMAPTVAITSPANGSKVAIRSTLNLAASASDNVSVSRVTFYLDNVTIKGCTDTVAPYTCAWKVPAQKGKTYSFTAIAADPSGNIGYSSAVNVTSQ